MREQVATGAYSNPSDYVRALIRADRKRVEEERLEQMLLDGLASGVSEEPMPEFMARVRRETLRQE